MILNVIELYRIGILDAFEYLTTWGAWIAMISFILILISARDQNMYPNENSKSLFWKVALIVFEIALSLEILITILYWALMFNPNKPLTFLYLNF